MIEKIIEEIKDNYEFIKPVGADIIDYTSRFFCDYQKPILITSAGIGGLAISLEIISKAIKKYKGWRERKIACTRLEEEIEMGNATLERYLQDK